ncbi:hypothetical protein OAP18_02345 [Gammaproteobacteria bacterium]|nr:hypothetical protein [Gammaproteobacteria bacterium]
MLNTKQYIVEFGTGMTLYSITLFFSIAFLASNPGSPWRIWISILPIIPAILSTFVVIRALKMLDELQQRVQLTSYAVSFAIVGLTTFTYGFLENVGFPHIPYVWIFPFMISIWGITTPIVARLYR